MKTVVSLIIVSALASAVEPTKVRATLQPTKSRQSAPAFALPDVEGKIANLKGYRGKIVLLDFWATWCHGCKEEIPWFAEFERKYSKQGLAVVGVSLDEDGWKAVEPFLKTADVPYRIVLGNDSTAKKYNIGNMPDTFLIDRRGRIAATYVGLVDRVDIESNIRAMLAQH